VLGEKLLDDATRDPLSLMLFFHCDVAQFVYIWDNFGNRREEVVSADTSTVDPGYRADLELGGGARIFVSVGRPPETEAMPQVSLQLFVRDEAICEVASVLSDQVPELVCTYTFN